MVVGKFLYKTDIRKYGSGNLGATNTFRVLGKTAAIVVAIGDLLKGTISCLIPQLLGTTIDPIYCGILAIIGHAYPIFAGFRGGKAVATSAGVFLFLAPLGTFFGFLVFLFTLITSKFVSLSSIVAGITVFIYSLIFEDNLIKLLSLFVCIFLIVLHKQNIKRILNGTENKIGNKNKNN